MSTEAGNQEGGSSQAARPDRTDNIAAFERTKQSALTDTHEQEPKGRRNPVSRLSNGPDTFTFGRGSSRRPNPAPLVRRPRGGDSSTLVRLYLVKDEEPFAWDTQQTYRCDLPYMTELQWNTFQDRLLPSLYPDRFVLPESHRAFRPTPDEALEVSNDTLRGRFSGARIRKIDAYGQVEQDPAVIGITFTMDPNPDDQFRYFPAPLEDYEVAELQDGYEHEGGDLIIQPKPGFDRSQCYVVSMMEHELPTFYFYKRRPRPATTEDDNRSPDYRPTPTPPPPATPAAAPGPPPGPTDGPTTIGARGQPPGKANQLATGEANGNGTSVPQGEGTGRTKGPAAIGANGDGSADQRRQATTHTNANGKRPAASQGSRAPKTRRRGGPPPQPIRVQPKRAAKNSKS